MSCLSIAKAQKANRGDQSPCSKAMLAFLLAGVASCALAAAPAGKRPNVVYLLADQWRASATGYAGDPNVKTPQLDRLARQSLRFDNAVSVCPVCTPYRAALMTGRYPTSTGMFLNDLYLPDAALCMGEIYHDAGYDTAYIGKWHLDGHGRSAYIPPERRQGFDYWKGAECDHNYPHSHYYTGSSPDKRFWEGYDAFAQTTDAQQYLRGRSGKQKPFLLMVSYGTPHFPHHTAPEEYVKLYPPESLKLPPNVPAAMFDAVRKELPGYYAHCTALDKCIGEIVATLAETKLADDTILIFTADHGEMMGAQSVRPCMKQVAWDESIRVPLLLRWPAVLGNRARIVRTPIDTPDILPTLLGLCGLPIPQVVEGDDLSGLVRGTAPESDRAALVMNVSPFIRDTPEYRGIRTPRYTYVRNLEGPWLLYDNQTDPYQLKNLVQEPSHAALRAELDARLLAELKRRGDVFRPAAEHVAEWGYRIQPGGSVPYTPKAPMQTPNPQVFQREVSESLTRGR